MSIHICLDCGREPYTRLEEWRVPDPIPADYICPHFRPEYWEAKGYARNWGDAAVMMWPDLEILRKGPPFHGGTAWVNASFVILAPTTGMRRPVILEYGWGSF